MAAKTFDELASEIGIDRYHHLFRRFWDAATEAAEANLHAHNSEMDEIIAGIKVYIADRLAVYVREGLSPGVHAELMNVRQLLGR